MVNILGNDLSDIKKKISNHEETLEFHSEKFDEGLYYI